MPQFANITTICAYRDRSTKGPTKPGARHDCWRVEKYANGHRIRLGRVQANSKEAAIAQFS